MFAEIIHLVNGKQNAKITKNDGINKGKGNRERILSAGGGRSGINDPLQPPPPPPRGCI